MKKLLIILLLLPCLTYSQAISAWWLNGDATDRIGANNGVAHNMTYVAGMQGQAGNFNGTNGYVAANGVPFQFGTTTWSVSFIVTGSTGSAVSCQTTGTGWRCYMASSKMWFNSIGTGGAAIVDTGTTIIGQLAGNYNWHHVVYVITQDLVTLNNNVIDIYINGIVEPRKISRTRVPLASTDSLRIGRRYISSPAYWTGNIDDVIIEQRAWTAAEIKQKYLYYKGLMQQ